MGVNSRAYVSLWVTGEAGGDYSWPGEAEYIHSTWFTSILTAAEAPARVATYPYYRTGHSTSTLISHVYVVSL